MEDKKIKVVIVSPSLNIEHNVSGVSAVTNFIIEHNRECEYEHFMQGRDDGENGLLNRLLRVLRNYRVWKEKLKKVNDIVIHYNYPLDAPSIVRDYFFLKAAKKRRIPMVIHIHGGLYLFKEQKPIVVRKILNEVFSWDNPFIVQSNKEREQIQRLYGAKNVSVLPNCVELGAADSYIKEITDEPLNILYLGRIEPNKGMDYLLDAVSKLKMEGQQFVLHFAGIEQGQNRYVERFRDYLGESFVYEGVVSGEKKTKLFKRCQAFLLPSLYEGLPMSLLETMSFGIVPIVTDGGSIGEYVIDGTNGLIIKMRDDESIIEAIRFLDRSRGKLQKMSEAARRTIFKRLRPEEYVKKLNMIYRLMSDTNGITKIPWRVS